MKTLKVFALTTCFLLTGLFSQDAQAQIDVTINPIGALFGSFSVGGDFALTESISVEGVVGFSSRKDDGTKYSAIPITAFGKYYFNPKNGIDKFYVSAFMRFVNRKYKDNDDNDSFNYGDFTNTRFVVGVGVGVGYKVISKGGFVFDIGLAGGRAFINNTKTDDNFSGLILTSGDLMLTGKLGIGYRFNK
ncbi:MAG: hypothetical protein ACI9XO_003125 [Paraglaciecola sp.]|jgi:hypothetical protein